MKDDAKKSRGRPTKGKSKQSRKKQRQLAQEREEEQRLTSLIFGGAVTAAAPVSNVHDEEEREEEMAPKDSLFEIDRQGGSIEQTGEDSQKQLFSSEIVIATEAAKASEKDDHEEQESAWQDEDDMEVNLAATNRLVKLRNSRTENPVLTQQSHLEHRLRKRYVNTAQLSARTDWADIESKEDDGEDGEELEDSAEPLLLGNAHQLPQNILNTMRCPDANQCDPNQATVQAVHFHPGSDPERPLLLTAGFDKTLRFFQVGADKSEKVHGIHCRSTLAGVCSF